MRSEFANALVKVEREKEGVLFVLACLSLKRWSCLKALWDCVKLIQVLTSERKNEVSVKKLVFLQPIDFILSLNCV